MGGLPARERPIVRAARAPRAGGGGAGWQLGLVSTRTLILGVVGLLLALGLVMVLSASSVPAFDRTGDSYAYFKRQLVWVLAGLAVMLVTSRVDYRVWRRVALPLLLVTLAALAIVALHPGVEEVNGSSRWLRVGGLSVQPSELAKLALLLFASDVLARKEQLLGDVRHLLVPVLPVTLLLAALIMAQPDLGTTLLLCAIAFGLLFLAGGPLWVLLGLGLAGLSVGYQLIFANAERRERWVSFLDPAADPLDAGYQAQQGLYALGSGGLFGVGLGQSRQKWLYVPNAHTDFIFAIIGEELGLVGTMTVVLLFVLLAYAGVRTARRAPDAFGRYLAGGITVWVSFQAIVNMGAVVRVLPITGVPLPLVSFGGSSLLVLLAAMGILLAVARQAAGRRPVLAAVSPARPAAGRGRGAARTQRPGRGARAGPAAAGPRRGSRASPAEQARAHAARLAEQARGRRRRGGSA